MGKLEHFMETNFEQFYKQREQVKVSIEKKGLKRSMSMNK